jgi:2-keto-4-pentenoate hydratase/2-oxohepta-3-ene-1,7-dioic acid hydratase in catechol pathway
MLIARYVCDGSERWGRVGGDTLYELEGTPFEGSGYTGAEHPLDQAQLLPPCRNGKIIAVGLNYRDHAAELGMSLPQEPVIFMKPSTSLLPHGGNIIRPAACGRLDYEAELAMVVRDTCKDVNPREAPDHILGYCCANDVTARDLQKRDGQWTRAKSFDTFCPMGPWLETELDPGDLKVSLRLNGLTRQSSTTSMMIFSPYEIFSFVSGIMTLLPGDVIITGTPPGVGEMRSGDTVEVEIEGIGVLRNTVA